MRKLTELAKANKLSKDDLLKILFRVRPDISWKEEQFDVVTVMAWLPRQVEWEAQKNAKSTKSDSEKP